MKLRTLFGLLMLLTVIVARSKEKNYPKATFVEKAKVIDGKTNDWPEIMNYYDSKAKIAFSLANDKAFFYTCIVISDEGIQQKILRNGIRVSVDTMGKKADDLWIQYPVRHQAGQRPTQSGRPPKMEDIKQQFRMHPASFEYGGFASKKELGAQLDWDSRGQMVIEFKFPLTVLKKVGKKKKKPLAIQFKVDALSGMPGPPSGTGPKAGGPPGGGRGGGSRPNGGGGRPGGAPGGSRPTTGNADAAKKMVLFEEQKTRQVFVLGKK